MIEHQILTIEEVVQLLRVSRSTVDRWVQESRAGRNDFPIPFTKKRQRVLWTADVIHDWIQRCQSAAAPPVNVPTAKQRKKQEREYQERQKRATAALERHGLNRKAKGEA